jgi:hypothetical protein
VYFYGLNYKYLKIHHEIIKHVIWLGKNIEVNMVLDFMRKSMIKNIFNQELSTLLWMKVGASILKQCPN